MGASPCSGTAYSIGQRPTDLSRLQEQATARLVLSEFDAGSKSTPDPKQAGALPCWNRAFVSGVEAAPAANFHVV